METLEMWGLKVPYEEHKKIDGSLLELYLNSKELDIVTNFIPIITLNGSNYYCIAKGTSDKLKDRQNVLLFIKGEIKSER